MLSLPAGHLRGCTLIQGHLMEGPFLERSSKPVRNLPRRQAGTSRLPTEKPGVAAGLSSRLPTPQSGPGAGSVIFLSPHSRNRGPRVVDGGWGDPVCVPNQCPEPLLAHLPTCSGISTQPSFTSFSPGERTSASPFLKTKPFLPHSHV